MAKKIFLSTFLLIISTLFSPFVTGVEAAFLKFDPASVTSTVGNTFDIKLNIDAGSDTVNATDIVVLYNTSLLEVQSVADGTFFPTVSSDTSTAGRLYVAGYIDPGTPTGKTGTGTVATATFKVKAAGSSELTFDCTQGSQTDSNIASGPDATDVIVCSSNNKATISTSGGSSGNGTGDDGGSGTGGAETPSELPQSGIIDNILKYAVPGILLILVGGAVKLIL